MLRKMTEIEIKMCLKESIITLKARRNSLRILFKLIFLVKIYHTFSLFQGRYFSIFIIVYLNLQSVTMHEILFEHVE